MLGLVWVLGPKAMAAECSLEQDANGQQRIQIGSVVYAVLTDQDRRDLINLKKDLDASKAINAELEKQLAAYERIGPRADVLIEHQKHYIEALEESLAGYRDLAQDYKRLNSSGRWLTLQAGVGATRGSDPALLVGVGVQRLRIWGFLEQNNPGVLIGAEWPLF